MFGNGVNSKRSHLHRRMISDYFAFANRFNIIEDIIFFSKIRKGYVEEAHHADIYDLLQICHFIDTLAPRYILEYGSGVSTAAIICLIKKLGRTVQFQSIDSDEKWADLNNNAIIELLSNIDNVRNETLFKILYAKASIENINGCDSYIHSYVPDFMPDFIYLDGPPLVESKVCLDIIKYNKFNEKTTIVIDGRDKNAFVLHEMLQTASTGWVKLNFAYPSNDTVIINKNNPAFSEVKAKYSSVLLSN